MIFRNALGPYLYTAARHTYDNAVAAVHPLYYDWPELPQAYPGTDDPAHTNPAKSNETAGYATKQYLLGESIMVAPITASSTNGSQREECTVGEHWGCVDAHWANRGLFATSVGNFQHLTLADCADKCAQLNFKTMGVAWGGVGHGSQCLCGNTAPPPSKVLRNDPECTAQPCSGNKTQNCGGNWRIQVFQVDCKTQLTPPPATKTIWMPPGDWVDWNTSSSSSQIIRGADTGVVIKDRPYALHEIPMFARAGAVVPTQTMEKDDGPLVWIIFPSAGSNVPGFSNEGNGTNYNDDGNTTRYIQSEGTAWAHLQYRHAYTNPAKSNETAGYATKQSASSDSMSVMSINISGSHGHDGDAVQLRRLPGGPDVQQVTCGGKTLPQIDPPSDEAPKARVVSAAAQSFATAPVNETSKVGWWVVPHEQDSLWQAAGSVMISLPKQESDNSGSPLSPSRAIVVVSFRAPVKA